MLDIVHISISTFTGVPYILAKLAICYYMYILHFGY